MKDGPNTSQPKIELSDYASNFSFSRAQQTDNSPIPRLQDLVMHDDNVKSTKSEEESRNELIAILTAALAIIEDLYISLDDGTM